MYYLLDLIILCTKYHIYKCFIANSIPKLDYMYLDNEIIIFEKNGTKLKYTIKNGRF